MSALTIGKAFIGDEPIAGSPLHAPAVIVITAPTGTSDSGGPELTVTWTYAQDEGDLQERYRVRVTNDAGTTEHYDSGWLYGASTSHAIDWDALELPADSSDITVELSVFATQGGGTVWPLVVQDSEAIVMAYGVPHCTITAPVDGSIWTDADSINCSWTFTDDVAGRTQGSYRIRILDRVSDIELYDTGWTVSASTSVEVPFTCVDGQLLTVEIQLKNENGMRSD